MGRRGAGIIGRNRTDRTNRGDTDIYGWLRMGTEAKEQDEEVDFCGGDRAGEDKSFGNRYQLLYA